MERYKLDYNALAQRIKQARKEKGYSQSKLAELAGVSTNTIGNTNLPGKGGKNLRKTHVTIGFRSIFSQPSIGILV